MKDCVKKLFEDRSKTLAIMSFTSAGALNVPVKSLVTDPEIQARGIIKTFEDYPLAAAAGMMDLSVEAEAFGCETVFSENSIPEITKGVIDGINDAESLEVPPVGAGRTGIFTDAVKKAKLKLKDEKVLAGVIGPYSLAGRLFDMSELMISCFEEPELTHTLLEKSASFITAYILAFKEAGADGIVIAEPAAGLLSPSLAEEFSNAYVRKIIEAVSDDGFIVVYHNCGASVCKMTDEIKALGADVYHFGNACDIAFLAESLPGSMVLGNLDPVLLRDGDPGSVTKAALEIKNKCGKYENFRLSPGCDVPCDAKTENLKAFFGVL